MKSEQSKTAKDKPLLLVSFIPIAFVICITSCSDQIITFRAPDTLTPTPTASETSESVTPTPATATPTPAPTLPANTADTIYAPRVDGITVDGDLSEWANIRGIDVSHVNGVWDQGVGGGASTSASDCSYTFKVAWDSTGLYVAIEVTDDVIANDSTTPGEIKTSPINHPWEDDTMEVFIDGDYSRTAHPTSCRNQTDFQSGGEFSLVYNGAATSDESGFKEEFGTSWLGKTGTRDGKYCYEYKLTWRVMGQESMPEKIGFTLSYQDDDDGGNAREHALYWQGRADNPPLYEDGWGTLYFVE